LTGYPLKARHICREFSTKPAVKSSIFNSLQMAI